ncbi:hypothetical protein C8T65DRAFT_260502 [Cerioporus squamosus]|nr:hypothetical protein C8T65DRAFT_260502 [Cerioporus squamosus]
MHFRVPKWYLLALLYALLASTGRAVSISSRMTARGDDSDDDDDNGDDSDGDGDGNQHHRAGSNGSGVGTLTKHHISGGAIAGIVIGVILLLVLLVLLGLWCLRRRRRARAQQAAVLTAAAAAPSMRETSTAPLLVQHPTSLQPKSPVAPSPTDSTIPGRVFFADTPGRPGIGTQEMRNIAPGALDTASLPNPYDGDTPPQPPPRDAPPCPTSPVSPVSRYASLNSSSLYSSNRQSTAPSAWTHDESGEALLSRGATHASRVSTSSSLHDELSGYQKRLEAHHRKEEEDALRQQLGEGSGVPADPPPVYSPSEER